MIRTSEEEAEAGSLVRAMTVTLGGTEVHVWYAFPHDVSEPGLIAWCYALLGADERDRYGRLISPQDRHEYLVTHALIRMILSQYAGGAPGDWVFGANQHGRPHVVSPHGGSPIRFSLSHTKGLVACACAVNRDVGVDVENTERRVAIEEIAPAALSPEELHCLRGLPEAIRNRRFFEIWTLKEAYVKARGVGLLLPFDRFTMRFEPHGAIEAKFDPSLKDIDQEWQFLTARPTSLHQLAVAVRRDGNVSLGVTVRDAAPLLARVVKR